MAHLGGSIDGLTAREAGLAACTVCARLGEPGTRCRTCGAALHSRRPRAAERALAWLLAGIVAYVPANLYPMLVTRTLGEEDRSTIIGGVILLAQSGSWFVALIVGVASVLVPIGKFIVIGMLLGAQRRGWALDPHRRMHLYEVTEFIGRWSMIDVFVVAILAALVQMDLVAAVEPGVAALAFALSVIFTMLSARALDPRAIWDGPPARPQSPRPHRREDRP